MPRCSAARSSPSAPRPRLPELGRKKRARVGPVATGVPKRERERERERERVGPVMTGVAIAVRRSTLALLIGRASLAPSLPPSISLASLNLPIGTACNPHPPSLPPPPPIPPSLVRQSGGRLLGSGQRWRSEPGRGRRQRRRGGPKRFARKSPRSLKSHLNFKCSIITFQVLDVYLEIPGTADSKL